MGLPALVIGAYLYTQLDDQIRRHVEEKLARHYTDFNVVIGSAQFLEGRGIEIRGLSIEDPNGEEPLVEVDELFVVCSPTLTELVQNQLVVERIIVRRPRLHATRRADGSWDVTRLLPLPKFGDNRPEATIENATVHLVDASKSAASGLTLREINLTVIPQPATDTAMTDASRLAVRGTLGGDLIERIDLEGLVDPNRSACQLKGTVTGLQVGPELLAALPCQVPPQVAELKSLRAKGNLSFAFRSKGDGAEPEFAVSAELAQGRVDDPRLPYPLDDLKAQVRCANNFLAIDRLTARHGQTTISLAAQQQGLGANKPVSISARAHKVIIDREMVAHLPESLRDAWHKYLPMGEVDIDAQLSYDGQSWEPNILVQCTDVSFSYHKFPYRLERGSGTLRYQFDRLSLDLTAHSGESPIHVTADVAHPGPRAVGWAELRGDDILLEDRLIEALPEKARRVVRALHPAARMSLDWRSWRDDPDQIKPRSKMTLHVNEGAIRYDRFAYPLTNIRGTIEMEDGNWTFRDWEGTNDTGFVTCKGNFVPAEQGSELTLLFAGAEVPLEAELRDALTPGAQRLWNDLKPRGHIDLTATVRYQSASRKLDLTVRVEPTGEETSVEPVAFPYRFENLHGSLTYRDGFVRFDNLRAKHGRTTWSARGTSQIRPDHSWYLYFESLAIDRARADRELLMALPSGLRRAVTKLNPTGPINVRGAFGLSKAGEQNAPIQSRWDVSLNLHDSDLDCGVLLRDVYGEVRLTGNFDGRRFQSRGELSLDSLTFKDHQFTEIAGPLWLDNDRVLLGRWANPERRPEPRRITGKLYEGTLVGDGWVMLEDKPRFSLQASLGGASLERFVQESMVGEKKLKGQVYANLELHGTSHGTHDLGGSGAIQLRNADIYELPLMVQLLKVLSVRPPDATAFTKSDMHFRIRGEHLYFDKLDFLGDAVSLYGKGEMDFDRKVKLSFHSIVGRNDLAVPLVRKLVGEASGQIMLIHVRGTLEKPVISNEAFPGVNQALQQLQADFQGASKQSTIGWDPRTWFGLTKPTP